MRARFEHITRLAPPTPGLEDPLADGPVLTELQRRFLHPFTGWEQHSSLLHMAELQARANESSNAFEVWILGGSVAEMVCGAGAESLSRTLSKDPRLAGREVRIFPLARGGWKVPQPLFAAQWMWMLGHAPDAIVLVDGFNEVAIALDNSVHGTHPLYPSFPHWSTLAESGSLDLTSMRLFTRAADAHALAGTLARRALAWGFARSSLASSITLDRVRSTMKESAAAQAEAVAHLRSSVDPAILAGPRFDPGDDAVLDAAVRGWAEGARELHDFCAARGIAHVHVLQPTLHDPGSKPMTSEEQTLGTIAETWRRGVVGGYPRLRASGAQLAAQGVPFVDGSRLFADDERTLYIDACHVGTEGNRVLGEWLAERLLERLPPQ